MKSAILSVGTEILFGQITNTNSVYLSQELNLLGIDVMYHYTVGDNPKRLAKTIRSAFEDCDLVITTGGLGPTQDDMTKEIACEILDDELVYDEAAFENIKAVFTKLKRVMTDNNKKQAYFPKRAKIFYNEIGTAPGFALENNGKIIICLPGPPREMKEMFELKAKPYLEAKSEDKIYYRMLRMFGIGESALETTLLDLIDEQTDPTLATYAKESECGLRVASKRKTKEEAKQAVNNMIEVIKERVGKHIYSYDNENIHQVVAKRLIAENISISCAESCTGGLFAETLTKTPGISKVFDRGVITYSNQAKVEELGVKQETLDKYGAVSLETAREMARGIQKKTGSRIGISITGVAGPDGGTPEKPVGFFCICVVMDGKEEAQEFQSRHKDRTANRNFSMLCMMHMIIRLLNE